MACDGVTDVSTVFFVFLKFMEFSLFSSLITQGLSYAWRFASLHQVLSFRLRHPKVFSFTHNLLIINRAICMAGLGDEVGEYNKTKPCTTVLMLLQCGAIFNSILFLWFLSDSILY